MLVPVWPESAWGGARASIFVWGPRKRRTELRSQGKCSAEASYEEGARAAHRRLRMCASRVVFRGAQGCEVKASARPKLLEGGRSPSTTQAFADAHVACGVSSSSIHRRQRMRMYVAGLWVHNNAPPDPSAHAGRFPGSLRHLLGAHRRAGFWALPSLQRPAGAV